MTEFPTDAAVADLHCEGAADREIGGGPEISLGKLRDIYRSMLTARCIDDVEAEMTSGGEAFFHVSGAGHEGSAILNLSLIPEDWLHLHYRDKALLLAESASDVFPQPALQRCITLGGAADERSHERPRPPYPEHCRPGRQQRASGCGCGVGDQA